MDIDELITTWKSYLARLHWERAMANAEASGDTAGIRAAELALTTLPAVSALEALHANAELVSILSGQRWLAMKAARDQGATLEEIGKALGVSRQSAWEVYQRKIAEYQQHQQRRNTPQDQHTGAALDEKGASE